MGKSHRTSRVPFSGDISSSLSLPSHEAQRGNESAASEHLEGTHVLLIEVHDGRLGRGCCPRGSQEHRHHAISAGVRVDLTGTTVDNHGSDARRGV